jgi:hypothetical protein
VLAMIVLSSTDLAYASMEITSVIRQLGSPSLLTATGTGIIEISTESSNHNFMSAKT